MIGNPYCQSLLEVFDIFNEINKSFKGFMGNKFMTLREGYFYFLNL